MTNVRIVDWRHGALTVSAIKAVRDATDLGLADAKAAIDTVLERSPVELTLSDPDGVDAFIRRLSEFGFVAERAGA